MSLFVTLNTHTKTESKRTPSKMFTKCEDVLNNFGTKSPLKDCPFRSHKLSMFFMGL